MKDGNAKEGKSKRKRKDGKIKKEKQAMRLFAQHHSRTPQKRL